MHKVRTISSPMGPITLTESDGFIELKLSDNWTSVTVNKPHDTFGRNEEARVNWSGMGAKTPVEAMAYATLITIAATIADELNAEMIYDAEA